MGGLCCRSIKKVAIIQKLKTCQVHLPTKLLNWASNAVLLKCNEGCIDAVFEGQLEENRCLSFDSNETLLGYWEIFNDFRSNLATIQDYRLYLIYMDEFKLLKKLIFFFLPEEEESHNQIIRLSRALHKTNNFLKIFSETEYRSMTPSAYIGFFDLKELKKDFDRDLVPLLELTKLCNVVDLEKKLESMEHIIVLKNVCGYVPDVRKACLEFRMDNCLKDQCMIELEEIHHKCMNEDSFSHLTPEEAKEYLDQVKHSLRLEDSSDHMQLFKEITRCERFFKFVTEQFFGHNNDEAKALVSFTTWYDIVSNQLQKIEFEEQVLQHMLSAFRYVIVFVNKQQSLTQLIERIKKLDSSQQFKELRTVEENMHHIHRWSSLAEGDITVENVQKDLKCILNSGRYEFRKNVSGHFKGHAFTVYLIFTENELSIQWSKSEISDFEHKLALLDDLRGREEEISQLMEWNEIVRRMHIVIEQLYELGYPDYKTYSDANIYIRSASIKAAEKKVNEAEKAFENWQGQVHHVRRQNKWLLLLTITKINHLYEVMTISNNTDAICEEIRYLFSPEVESILYDAVSRKISDSVGWSSAMSYVGLFFEDILKNKSLLDNIILSHKSYKQISYGGILHAATGFSHSQIIKLLIDICHHLPKHYDVLYCNSNVTEHDLKLFVERCCKFGDKRQFYLLEVNQLNYEQQEILMNMYQDIQHDLIALHFIETAPSLLREVPGIHLQEHTKEDIERILLQPLLKQKSPKDFMSFHVEVVYGMPGVGKTHYIRKQLSMLSQHVVIAMNETFTKKTTIKKLKSLASKPHSGIFFNFTMTDPGDTLIAEHKFYTKWVETVSWFFVELLILGYVEDPESGESFQMPVGLNWVVFVEVPTEDSDDEISLKKFIDAQFPVFSAFGNMHHITCDLQYDIDENCRLVYKYLRAYESGRINALCVEEIKHLGLNKMRISLPSELSESKFHELLRRHRLGDGYQDINKRLFVAYKEKRISTIYIQAYPISFKNDSCPSDEKCWAYIYKRMPEVVRQSKLMQQIYIRYLAERFNFLENCPGYNYNNGLGSSRNTNSVALGSTLMDVMIIEVNQMCQQADTSQKVYQQLIYDFKDNSGTFGFLCTDISKVSKDLLHSLRSIGVEISNDAKRDMKERTFLDLMLSRALQLDLVGDRLQILDEHQYVLTLDFASKMLNINERRKCGLPVLIEGETGVGKTALIEMLSCLWNSKYDAMLKDCKLKVLSKFEEELQKMSIAENKQCCNLLRDCIKSGSGLKKTDMCSFIKQHNDGEKCIQKLLKNYFLNNEISGITECEVNGHVYDLQGAFLLFTYLPANCEVMDIITAIFNCSILSTFHKLDVHAGLSADDIVHFFNKVFKQAQDIESRCHQSLPFITVYLDEINTSSYLGFLKEIVVDQTIEGKKIPSNVFVIAACNPHRSDSTAVSRSLHISDSYNVRKLHSTLLLLKWDYGALSTEQEVDYINEKLSMVNSEMETTLNQDERDNLANLISTSQTKMRSYLSDALQRIEKCSKDEAERRAMCCVSQRDVQRVIKFYKWLIQNYSIDTGRTTINEDHHRHAMLVSLGLVYYMRLPAELREDYMGYLDDPTRNIGELSFEAAMQSELDWYCDNLDLPPGIAKTDALKENLLAIILCCVTRTPLIIEGAPGTSKTLSFNIAVANLKGSGSKKELFHHAMYPSLEPHFYQCSRRTTSDEVQVVFERAIRVQQGHIDKTKNYSVVFMDEAGLPKAHESLKILHYYLEHPVVSFVAITNLPLDAAKTNRAVSVYRPESSKTKLKDLVVLARDCIAIKECEKIESLCRSYAELMKIDEYSKFFGLRDFIYFLIALKGKISHTTAEFDEDEITSIIQALERNFGGVKSASFEKVCTFFLDKIQPKQMRSVIDVLKASFDDRPSLEPSDVHASIQSQVRYQLIIDPSDDQSVMRLLFKFNLLNKHNSKMIVCSHLPGDIQGSVSTIAKIRHAAQLGYSLVLCQADDIQESFYDLFNQRFRCVYIKNENRYYVNISCGAHSKMSRIHQDFRCSVILRENDLESTPGPFLNRFEKYYISYEVFLDHCMRFLPDALKNILNAAIFKVNDFVSVLGKAKSFYGFCEKSTVQSLLIKTLPNHEFKWKPVKLTDIVVQKVSNIACIISILQQSLQKVYGFNFNEEHADLSEEEANEIFTIMEQEGIISDLISKMRNESKEPQELLWLVNDAFEVLASSSKEALPEVYMVITALTYWLTRYFCKYLMQILTPEGLAIHYKSISPLFRKHYMDHQEHFGMKELIHRHLNSRNFASKLLCYTRSSSLSSKLFPERLLSRSTEQNKLWDNHIFSERKLQVCKFSDKLSQGQFEHLLKTFMENSELEVFVIVVGVQQSSRKKQLYINQLRIIIEQFENENMTKMGNKLIVLLLLFPPSTLSKACYPCIFLEGWEHVYLDAISQARYDDADMSRHINIRDWFRQFCLEKSSHILTKHESYHAFLKSLLKEVVPVLVSRLRIKHCEGAIFNREMTGLERSKLFEQLLHELDIGDILVNRFQEYWNEEVVSDFIQRAAVHTYHHDSTLNLANQIQVLVRYLFSEFLVYMIHVMNRNMGLEVLFDQDSCSTALLLKEMVKVIPLPNLTKLERSNYSKIFIDDCKNSYFTRQRKTPYFHYVYKVVDEIIGFCKDNPESNLTIQNQARHQWQSILQALERKDESLLLVFSEFIGENDGDIWQMYLSDFIETKFFHDTDEKLVQVNSDMLMLRLNSVSDGNTLVRMLDLHVLVTADHLSLTRALPTMRKVNELQSLHNIQWSPENMSNNLSKFVVHTLYEYISKCLNDIEPEDSLQKWYDIFTEVVMFKSFLYENTSEVAYWNQATVIWLCFLSMQCCLLTDRSIILVKDVFEFFKSRDDDKRLSLDDVLADGEEVFLALCKNEEDDIDQKFLQQFFEGVLEHFFSEHLNIYDESDLLWFFNYLQSQECDEVMKCTVAKFFFHRVLLKKDKSSASTTLDIFDDKVRSLLGSALCETDDWSPHVYRLEFYDESDDEDFKENDIFDMYFDITLEDLLNKSQVSTPRWYTICNKISESIENASPKEKWIFMIEKEAVVHALLQSLAREAKPRPNKEFFTHMTKRTNKFIDDMLSQEFSLERAFIYILCLLKNDKVSSVSKLFRLVNDPETLIREQSFMDPLLEDIPKEEIVCHRWHQFSFIQSENNSDVSVLYESISHQLIEMNTLDDAAQIEARFGELSEKWSESSLTFENGMPHKYGFLMLLWLSIYYNFYIKKINSRRIAQAIGILDDKYDTRCLAILKCFLDPTNYVAEHCQPPLDFSFNPDLGIYPLGNDQVNLDCIYNLFVIRDDDDELKKYMRHSIANVIAAVLCLPPESNHLWYHLFDASKLHHTFVTGYLYNRFMTRPYFYDCGIDLSISGDYGSPHYDRRGPLSLKSLYTLLFFNFSAFSVLLYSQPEGDNMLNGSVLTASLPPRTYTAAQLQKLWYHMQQSFQMSVEGVSLTVTRCLEKFLQLATSRPECIKRLIQDEQEYNEYERLWNDEICEPSFTESEETVRSKENESKVINQLRALERQYPYHFYNDVDLRNALSSSSIAKDYQILSSFVQNYPILRCGGSLLPDLMRFYQWLHNDCPKVTEEESHKKTLHEIVIEYCEQNSDPFILTLYNRVKEKFNQYSQLIGGKIGIGACSQIKRENKLDEINDETPLFIYLSTNSSEEIQADWLFHVLNDLIEKHNDLLSDFRKCTKTELLCLFPECVREIHPLEVDFGECIVNEDASNFETPRFIQLIRRRWKYGQKIEEADLKYLEIDVILHYLADKPQVSSSDFRTLYRFRAPYKIVSTSIISSVIELCGRFERSDKNEMSPQQQNSLAFYFHFYNYEQLYGVLRGLQSIADHFIKKTKDSSDDDSLCDKNMTLPDFLSKTLGVGVTDVFAEVGLEKLSEDGRKCLEKIELQHLHATVMFFVDAIKDGYYDFHTLPISMKKPLNPNDYKTLDTLKEIAKFDGTIFIVEQQFHSHLQMLNDNLINAQGFLIDNMSQLCQESIVSVLKDQLEVVGADNKVAIHIPPTVLVENYMHLRIILRRHLQNISKQNQTYKKWEMIPSTQLWSEYLPYVRRGQKLVEESAPSPGVSQGPNSGATATSNSGDDWILVAQGIGPDGVCDYLESINCEKYIEEFKNAEVDGAMLVDAIQQNNREFFEYLGVKHPVHKQKIISKFQNYCKLNIK